ncbi:alpha/beta fold hydrolase [Roseospirillum parvum]|uniref:Pimeloyl-ACP methyl ester carboxylesterase n=1 Tax=Roseospirillum parvum TaxID=83401 RepID=A0A1G7UA85_9PROT|nr:alpha/beta hydrolase [Roseospirillum parvum]SDG44374.1 Pimeloyl-ACP methyl ester carboxylesterase [Roseospirillum parvum]
MTVIGHEIVGQGPTKVMVLHGWFGDHTAFGPLMPYLDTETFTYAFMDYRGYGKSRDMKGKYTMDEIAADALALADHLEWDGFHLIGHSMGGMAVQRITANAPKRVKSVICLTPVPANGFPFDDEGWALFTGAAEDDGKRAGIIDFTTGSRLSKSWVQYMVKRSRETTTQAAFAAYLPAWGKTDFMAEMQGRETPFLVIVGQHDPALTAALMKTTYLKALPDCRLEVMANAGHYPMQETPVALATRIEAFMRSKG